METLLVQFYAAGLSELWEAIQKDWLGPLFFAAVAVFAIIFVKDRAWMKLIGFVGIAAIVGVLIFAGDSLFGKGDAGLTGTAADLADKVGKKPAKTDVIANPLGLLSSTPSPFGS